jgi:hypothetical protein
MPRMHRDRDVMAPKGLLFGLLAATLALPGAVLAAVSGQAIGSLLGGCGWIGISTPLDRQVWALVNQPSLNFASLPRGLGYWLGSLLLPLVICYCAVHLLPRSRTLAAELTVLHLAWGCTTVAVAWLPLLDTADGHLRRMLELWRLPHELLWVVPILAVPGALPPTLRLLALLRTVRKHPRRGLRLATVGVHLVLPVAAWVLLATMIRGAPAFAASIGLLAPVVTALAIAWYGYPYAFPHRLRELKTSDAVRTAVFATVVVATIWLTGRPLADGRASGLLWASPKSYNNIRQWVEPISLRPGTVEGVLLPPASPSS